MDLTATSPSDYKSSSGEVQFNPGDTTKTINIAINDDDIFEGVEYFLVRLSQGTNDETQILIHDDYKDAAGPTEIFGK